MKTTYELGSSDLKAAIELYMASQGTPVTDADTFSVDANGNVTIIVTKLVAPPVVTIEPPVVTITPLPIIIPPIAPLPVIISPAPPLVPIVNDRARCDAFTSQFTFPAECAYHHGTAQRIPEDVTCEDVAGDTGGLTMWGIDQSSHPGVDIRNLTMQAALDLYYAEWMQQKCNLLPTPLAECVHDTFESGGHPVQWLQQVLGVAIDGVLGPVTAAAANAADGKATALEFLVLRDKYFVELADTVAHDAQFKQGWLNRDTNLRKYLGLV